MKCTASIGLFIGFILCGCTVLHSRQTDGPPSDQRVTDLRATAWFSSAQHLDNLAASTTDKTQRFGMKAFQQQGATNALQALEAIARILEAIRPTP